MWHKYDQVCIGAEITYGHEYYMQEAIKMHAVRVLLLHLLVGLSRSLVRVTVRAYTGSNYGYGTTPTHITT